MSGQQRFGLCVSARHVVSCRSLTVPALSSTRIPTHVVICACEEVLRGPETLPANSCLLQINYNKSCNLFGARVLHFVLHFSPTHSCMCHDVARPEGRYTHCTAALRSQRLIACFSYTRCLFAKSRFPSRMCACRDRDRAAAARDSFSLLQILYRLHLRELSRFSRFISTYSHTHIHKHTSLHSCKLHSAPHRHCNEQHDGLVAVLGPVH